MKKDEMVKIRFNPEDEVTGYYILFLHGNIVCLSDDSYIVPKEVLKELKEKNIGFEIEVL